MKIDEFYQKVPTLEELCRKSGINQDFITQLKAEYISHYICNTEEQMLEFYENYTAHLIEKLVSLGYVYEI